MYIAHQILEEYSPFEVIEGLVHKHAPEERAEHYTTYGFDPATTEREYIELLHGLIRAEQPLKCLETGTGAGIGTLVMCAALAENNRGHLTTVDFRYLASLSHLAIRYGIDDRLTVVQSDSLQWVAEYSGDQFDFCLFDTIQEKKAVEAQVLLQHNKIAPGALLAFHDTSANRFHEDNNPDSYCRNYFDLMNSLQVKYGMQRIDFPHSRGITLMRLPTK